MYLLILHTTRWKYFLFMCCSWQSGYKVTKQGTFVARIGWEQTVYKKPAVESYQTAKIDVDGEKDTEVVKPSENDLLFKRVIVGRRSDEEEGDDMDHEALVNGYITVTPLGGISRTEADAIPYFKSCLSCLGLNAYPVGQSEPADVITAKLQIKLCRHWAFIISV